MTEEQQQHSAGARRRARRPVAELTVWRSGGARERAAGHRRALLPPAQNTQPGDTGGDGICLLAPFP